MMKAFLISVLVVGTALFLAALFLPDRSPPAAGRQQHVGSFAASAETKGMKQAPEHHNVSVMPPATAVAIERAPVISHREPTDGPPRRGQADFPPPTPQNEPVPDGSAPGRGQAHFAPKTSQNEPVPGGSGVDPKASPSERQTLAQTATSDTSLRNADFPRTYIRSIQVDLTSPTQWVRLTWAGPRAGSQETGPFHSSPGRGLGTNNCDDVAESNREDCNCTPKGTMRVQGFSDAMPTYAHCRFVTWFQPARGVAFHYHPDVPNYPASHGCVRLNEHAAQLIHNNSKIGETEVTVGGKWTFAR